ncbi:MAG: hypothetical protein JST28_03735 [Acidobacteria bacterium]|nr:hypothetical protein [Acidobacteriota bacterium]
MQTLTTHERQSGPSRVIGIERQCATPYFRREIVLEALRMERLRKYRLMFGIAALVCLCALAVCIYERVPYEPAAAALCCAVGIFMVFAMKVHDAQH